MQQTRISNIIKGRTGITADMATRLTKYFGTSAEVWMNLQSQYELRKSNNKTEKFLNK